MSPKPPIIIPLNLTRSHANGTIEISSPLLKPNAYGLFYYFKRDSERELVRFGVPRVDDLGGAIAASEIAALSKLSPAEHTEHPWVDEHIIDDVAYLLSPTFHVDQDLWIGVEATPQANAGGYSGGGYVRLRREGGGGTLGQ